jgi:hypothetical protein
MEQHMQAFTNSCHAIVASLSTLIINNVSSPVDCSKAIAYTQPADFSIVMIDGTVKSISVCRVKTHKVTFEDMGIKYFENDKLMMG